MFIRRSFAYGLSFLFLELCRVLLHLCLKKISLSFFGWSFTWEREQPSMVMNMNGRMHWPTLHWRATLHNGLHLCSLSNKMIIDINSLYTIVRARKVKLYTPRVTLMQWYWWLCLGPNLNWSGLSKSVVGISFGRNVLTFLDLHFTVHLTSHSS